MSRDRKDLNEGDVVRIKPHKLGEKKWKLGRIKKVIDKRSYLVEEGHNIYRRNKQFLVRTKEPYHAPSPYIDIRSQYKPERQLQRPTIRIPENQQNQKTTKKAQYRTRYGRTIQQPDRYGDPIPWESTLRS